MTLSFWDYVRAAFNARPIGMFVPPNWIGLGFFGLLGVLNPGFWLVGVGLELAYLGAVATNPRFQRVVAGMQQSRSEQNWQEKINQLVMQLGAEGQRRYKFLEQRCRTILEQQVQGGDLASGLEAQGEGLGRLLWVYLKLFVTRQAIERVLREATDTSDESQRLEQRVAQLNTRLKDESLGEELRKSLAGQLEILQQRLEKRREAGEKLAFLDAELTRIQEQVELVREQAVVTTDPQSVSQRIDQITSTLGGTNQWIREQQQIYGAVEDLMADPPPVSARRPVKEAQ